MLCRIAYVKRLGTEEKLEFMKTQTIAADMMRRGYQASKKGLQSDPFRINISQHFFLHEISLRMRCGLHLFNHLVSFNIRNTSCTPNSPYLALQ